MTKATTHKLTETQQARWDNARRWAEKVNSLIDAGCFVRIGSDKEECRRLTITGTRISEQYDETTRFLIFVADPEYDEGLYTTIEEFNRRHAIHAYQPVAEEITW